MLTHLLRRPPPPTTLLRHKTTSSQYVASRNRDPTFEKLMDNYKNLFKVISIQELILSTTHPTTLTHPAGIPLDFLNRLTQRLHLNRGATHFLCKYPHIFKIFNHPVKLQPFVALTETALKTAQLDAIAINASLPRVIERLVRLLSMSVVNKTVPLRAVFKVFRELGLPDDFEDSVILKRCDLFQLVDNSEVENNTHLLKLVGDPLSVEFQTVHHGPSMVCRLLKNDIGNCEFGRADSLSTEFQTVHDKSSEVSSLSEKDIRDCEFSGADLLSVESQTVSSGIPNCTLVAAVEHWRVTECCKEDCRVDMSEILYSFKHSYPPGMKLRRNFKAKVKEWQKLKYVRPYEAVEMGQKRRKSKIGMMEMEKRAVGIVHEFLSLTVEKMVEVEKISHFRKWFGIDLNIRDLFLDHPGIFYLSTKGYRHTVFLREAYERGCLIEPNPVYEARRKLLDLVILGRRGLSRGHSERMAEDGGVEDLKTDSDED